MPDAKLVPPAEGTKGPGAKHSVRGSRLQSTVLSALVAPPPLPPLRARASHW